MAVDEFYGFSFVGEAQEGGVGVRVFAVVEVVEVLRSGEAEGVEGDGGGEGALQPAAFCGEGVRGGDVRPFVVQGVVEEVFYIEGDVGDGVDFEGVEAALA